MKNQNLILTKKSMARHTKRLISEMKSFNHTLKLNEAQNMLARVFGCKDFHELNTILDSYENIENKTVYVEKNQKKEVNYKKNDNDIDSIFALFDQNDKSNGSLFLNSKESFLINCVKILNNHFSTMEISFFKDSYVDDNFLEFKFFNKNNDLTKIYKTKLEANAFKNNNIIENLESNEREWSKFQVSYYKDNIQQYKNNREILTYIFQNNNIPEMHTYKFLNENHVDLENINYVIGGNNDLRKQVVFSIANSYIKKYNPNITAFEKDDKYDLTFNNKGIIYTLENRNAEINLRKIQKRKLDFITNCLLSLDYELSLTGSTILTELNVGIDSYLDLIIDLIKFKSIDSINYLFFTENINGEEYIFSFNFKAFVKVLNNKNFEYNNTLLIEEKNTFHKYLINYINDELKNNNVDKIIKEKFLNKFNY